MSIEIEIDMPNQNVEIGNRTRMNGTHVGEIEEHQTEELDLNVAVAKVKIDVLSRIWRRNQSLLYKSKLGCFSQSILHVVASHDNVADVLGILDHDSELAEVLDSRSWSPFHVAAVKGHMNVLEKLLPHSLCVARVNTDHGDTILHLCVKHDSLNALKFIIKNIKDSEFANRKDAEGNTILHVAVMLGYTECVRHLLNKKIVDLSSRNANGNTALDIAHNNNKRVDGGVPEIEKLLKDAGALRTKHLKQGQWLIEKRDALMVVASLIATMAFQAAVSPPGGVWQENSETHRAGEAVMAFDYPDSYPYFLRSNTIGFVGSLSTILLLMTGLPFRKKIMMWILVVIMWGTISAMAVTYAIAITVVTPIKCRGPLVKTIVVGVAMWGCVMTLLLIGHSLVLLCKRFHPHRNFFRDLF
ncbi:ankyrin repeat-containing protein ITN1-like [Impatiens glandulifera]|uniref:ankyrin repeat-containing protein ITN1-like n=1 Tax=Impatiens glandulifera TaxID=253017 RepID=UPI001FB093B5|nr:ankyrin repeat-containing protein ITN1-like [Impatiens glandulifera]